MIVMVSTYNLSIYFNFIQCPVINFPKYIVSYIWTDHDHDDVTKTLEGGALYPVGAEPVNCVKNMSICATNIYVIIRGATFIDISSWNNSLQL